MPRTDCWMDEKQKTTLLFSSFLPNNSKVWPEGGARGKAMLLRSSKRFKRRRVTSQLTVPFLEPRRMCGKKHWVKSNLKATENTSLIHTSPPFKRRLSHIFNISSFCTRCLTRAPVSSTDESGVFCFVFSLLVCIHVYKYTCKMVKLILK